MTVLWGETDDGVTVGEDWERDPVTGVDRIKGIRVSVVSDESASLTDRRVVAILRSQRGESWSRRGEWSLAEGDGEVVSTWEQSQDTTQAEGQYVRGVLDELDLPDEVTS